MEPEIQDLLARNQQNLRDARAAHYRELRTVAAFAEGAISALEDVGSLTREEGRVWRDRIQEVLTEKSPAPRRRRRTAPAKQPTGRITRVIPGPLDPAAFLDGGVRVVAVELYEQFARIHWTISPCPATRPCSVTTSPRWIATPRDYPKLIANIRETALV